ncbi:MAG: ice-binding family protein [Bacteroidota bacterium]|nr:ice-binding family protein [Bacteroidota bacterium]
MHSKQLLPAIATLLVVFLGSCKKDNVSTEMSSAAMSSTAISAAHIKPGLAGTLAAVNLGVAGNFVILSKSGITDVYKSTITGDVGTSPITGAAIGVTCAEVTGTIYSVNAAGPLPCTVTNATRLTTAVGDMQTAYTDAAGRSNPDFVNLGAGNIGGKTLSPGLYKWTTPVIIPTDITIQGGPNDVYIFQVAGTLTISSGVKFILAGGVQAKNIFWQTAGSVTLGTTSHFEGNILGQTGINMQTGASINGRMLAQTAVTLQMNSVTQPQ